MLNKSNFGSQTINMHVEVSNKCIIFHKLTDFWHIYYSGGSRNFGKGFHFCIEDQKKDIT